MQIVWYSQILSLDVNEDDFETVVHELFYLHNETDEYNVLCKC